MFFIEKQFFFHRLFVKLVESLLIAISNISGLNVKKNILIFFLEVPIISFGPMQ